MYLKEPTIWFQVDHLGPWKPGSPANPMSGMCPRISRSMLPLSEIDVPEVALTIGGMSRLSAARLEWGSTATSLNAPEIVLRSPMMLRPLVSVPLTDGNLRSSSVVDPACTTRSVI